MAKRPILKDEKPTLRRPNLLVSPSPDSVSDTGQGRISNQLSKLIAYERTPSLFDEREIADRDNELRALQKLKEADIALCVERKNKPVILTSIQNRIVHALSYAISQEIETSEDIKRKITDPQGEANPVRRILNVSALAKLLFNSTRQRYKRQIINEMYRLSKIRQVQILSIKEGVTIRLTAPLIMLGNTIEDISTDEQNNPFFEADFLEVFFGSAFFVGITNRFAVLTPKLFEVWGKGGTGTELFSVLLSSIFSVYSSLRIAASKAEARIKKDWASRKLSKKELAEAIAEAKRTALTYELNASTIKRRVSTDYDSNPKMRRQFWIDLQNAIEGFKDLGLIDDGVVQRGARGQEKVLFILSESYTSTERQLESNTIPLLEEKTSKRKPSAF